MINESTFMFTGKAKTNLSLLVLKRDDLIALAAESDNLQEAIEEATEYILENEVPMCDYTKFKQYKGASMMEAQ